MRAVLLHVGICGLVILAGCATTPKQEVKELEKRQYVETDTGWWLVHDMNRPAPKVITPGTPSTQDQAGTAPSDAIVLFDGTDLSGWTSGDGGPARWVDRENR